jgi:hypothetical protein
MVIQLDRRLFALVAVALLPVALLCGAVTPAHAEEISGASSEIVYELRTYTTHDGRLPALETRFREHTMRLFEKHGIRNVGYWIPEDRPNTLIYLIAHESRDAVTRNWRAFAADPDWQAVARESTREGPILVEGGIVSVFMRATDYSPRL